MSDWPGPERGVFCIEIVDLISRSALVGFSLLRASNYYYRKGPVIVDNLTILTIHIRLLCITLLQIYCYGEISILFLFIFTRFFWKLTKFSIVYITTMILFFLSFFILKYPLSIFLTYFESVLSFYFKPQFFEAVK